MSINVITVDGPGGSGKGTLAIKLAHYLKWNYLDSGVHYRALAYKALKNDISHNDSGKLLKLLDDFHLSYKLSSDDQIQFILNNEDISEHIRSESCSSMASKIAVHQEVREVIVELQRACYVPPGLVTDGRDMGTIVFPDAKVKIFLYAQTEVTANRRYNQLKRAGIDVNLDTVLSEMKQRDMRDSNRVTAPLKAARDAYHLDTSDLSIEQVFQKAVNFIENILNKE